MKYEFIVDEKNKSFTFAGKEFKDYKMLYSAKDACYVMMNNSVPIKSTYDKFIEDYDIPPKTFAKVHNGIMTRLWLDPVRKYSKYLAFEGMSKKPIPYKLKMVHENLPLLSQAEKDGMRNLIPILFLYSKSPKEVRKIVGKSTWKALCKNSFTRNLHIMKVGFRYHINLQDIDTHQNVVNIKTLNMFTSGILKRGGNAPINFSEGGLWAANNYKSITSIPLSNIKAGDLRGLENIYMDTKRMANQEGKSFNPEWSYDKMYSKHEEYTNIINLRKYSPKTYPILKGNNWKEYNNKVYKATLLKNPLSVMTEGDTMKHCVASYNKSVERGDYLVYSITKNGERSSTLGVNVHKHNNVSNAYGIPVENGKKSYSFSQHYKQCNQRVTCEDEIQLAKTIIEDLNKGEK